MAKLIFGCGYLGLRVARLWRAAGQTVYAVTRSSERALALKTEGINPIVGDLAREPQLPLPQGVKTALLAIGFERQAGQPSGAGHLTAVASALASLGPAIDRCLYISSTGVYGQVGGARVDESSECRPTRDAGQACLAAEKLVMAGPLGQNAIILRLAGLYGPGRIPRQAELAAGQPIDAPARGWLNLIHVDDAARLVLLAEESAVPPRLYVVSDGQPVERSEYFAEICRLLGAPPPRFVESRSQSPASERATSDKRVNPQRMFDELKPRLKYPSYREGLAAIAGLNSTAAGSKPAPGSPPDNNSRY